MGVDFQNFLNWAEDRFKGDVLVQGNEIKINSIFQEDTKHHLWCNPYGGKYQREDGCYRCFYTDNKGTLVGLVMLVDGCSYGEAKELLTNGVNESLLELEKRLDEFFLNKDKIEECNLTLPICSSRIVARTEASNYLMARKIPIDNLYYCNGGDYAKRIVIPYYNPDKKLIYYNCRHIKDGVPRYLGPPKSVGVGKADVLYFVKWPSDSEKIYLTEGEFDAITLSSCGYYGAACGGKNLSDKQMFMLNKYKVCLCLDEDKAGFQGLLSMGSRLLSFGINTSFVRPPKQYKDWNKMLVSTNKENIKEYIFTNEKKFDLWSINELNLGCI